MVRSTQLVRASSASDSSLSSADDTAAAAAAASLVFGPCCCRAQLRFGVCISGVEVLEIVLGGSSENVCRCAPKPVVLPQPEEPSGGSTQFSSGGADIVAKRATTAAASSALATGVLWLAKRPQPVAGV